MYVRPRRHYRNTETGKTSPLLYDVIDGKATLRPGFTCGIRQGTWNSSPFQEVGIVPALEMAPQTLLNQEFWLPEAKDGKMSAPVALPILFAAVKDSVARNWQVDKFHIHFHSSGWDSRIISSAMRKLLDENGKDWLGPGLLFLSNRWEEAEALTIIESEGWPMGDGVYFTAYNEGTAGTHFARSLNFDRFWKTTNAPIPICGNLWWYLVEYAQENPHLSIPGDEDLQGFAGLFANETWRWFQQHGVSGWLNQYEKQYYYAAMAMYPQKIPVMEYPLSDIEVLKLVSRVNLGGDKLREAVARYACPQANDVVHHTYDDRGHKIAPALRKKAQADFDRSWYAKNVRHITVPETSEYNEGWCHWGLASLCEQLIKDGVTVQKS